MAEGNEAFTMTGQTEKQFAELMPITGTVETYFGDFDLEG